MVPHRVASSRPAVGPDAVHELAIAIRSGHACQRPSGVVVRQAGERRHEHDFVDGSELGRPVPGPPGHTGALHSRVDFFQLELNEVVEASWHHLHEVDAEPFDLVRLRFLRAGLETEAVPCRRQCGDEECSHGQVQHDSLPVRGVKCAPTLSLDRPGSARHVTDWRSPALTPAASSTRKTSTPPTATSQSRSTPRGDGSSVIPYRSSVRKPGQTGFQLHAERVQRDADHLVSGDGDHDVDQLAFVERL